MKRFAKDLKQTDLINKFVTIDSVVGICSYFIYNKYSKYIGIITNTTVKELSLTPSSTIELIDMPETFPLSQVIGKGNKGTYKSGTDPEFFVEANEKIIPAFSFLGSKKEPKHLTPIKEMPVYWDGFQAEFETQAQTCHGWSVDEIQRGLSTLLAAAKTVDKDAIISTKTLIQVTQEQLDNALPEHKAFGCMPSFNAYDMKGLSLPGEICPCRSAGGHIHMGMGEQTEASAIPVVKMLDNILGITGVSCFAKYDDPRRRRMYGLAGEYRLPKHGIEYRVLSNAWMFHPLTANIFLDLARIVWYAFEYNIKLNWVGNEEETIHIINNCDVKGARYVMERNKDLLLNILNACYLNQSKAKMVYEILLTGADAFVTDNIQENWKLNGGWIGHSDGKQANVNHYYNNIYTKQKLQEVS